MDLQARMQCCSSRSQYIRRLVKKGRSERLKAVRNLGELSRQSGRQSWTIYLMQLNSRCLKNSQRKDLWRKRLEKKSISKNLSNIYGSASRKLICPLTESKLTLCRVLRDNNASSVGGNNYNLRTIFLTPIGFTSGKLRRIFINCRPKARAHAGSICKEPLKSCFVSRLGRVP